MHGVSNSMLVKARRKLHLFYEKLKSNDYVVGLVKSLFIWALSTLLPVLFIWFFDFLKTNGEDGFSGAWSKFFVPGDIFVYTNTILAPSICFLLFNLRARTARWYPGLAMLIALVAICSLAIYAYIKSDGDFLPNNLWLASTVCYCVALIAWFFASVYEMRIGKGLQQRPQSGDRIMEEL